MKTKPWFIICWGPVESLLNGHFIRVYSLIENILKRLHIPILVIEYIEKKVQYPYSTIKIDNILKIPVLGNDKKINIMLKHLRFVLYQVVNVIKLRKILRMPNAIIIGGELFLPSLMLLKIMRGFNQIKAYLIADPQILLSEREERRGNKFVAKVLMFAEKVFFKMCDFTIAISPKMKIKISRFSELPKRVVIVPHVLPREIAFGVNCKECRGYHKGKTINIAFIGDLRMVQNLEATKFLIIALSSIKKFAKKPIILYIIGRTNGAASILHEIIKKYNLGSNIKIMGYIKNLNEILCNMDILLAPMFTMSGVSTKVLYYLRFKDKYIIASKEAVEGLDRLLLSSHKFLIISETPIDFVKKLIDVVKNLDDRIDR